MSYAIRYAIRNKRADTGSGAAAFILLLVLIITGYILAVKPEFRQEILDGRDAGIENGKGVKTLPPSVLLHEEPGVLENLKSERNVQLLSSIIVGSQGEPITVLKDRTIFVENTLFTEEADELSFKVDDPSNSDLKLSFQARKREGRLIISLNGETIYSNELRSITPNPISLPKEALREENVLSFRVSGPGFEFWNKNEYLLENVQVSGTFVNIKKLTGSQNFIVDTEDLLNAKKIRLDYTPVCLSAKDQGVLTVKVNEFVLSEGLPVCDSPVQREFTADKLRTGDNTLTAMAESGKYIIEPIKISIEYREARNPSYFFDLSKEKLESLGETNLEIVFSDDSQHSLTVFVNGHALHVDEANNAFSWNVREFLLEGKNGVKLVPISSGMVIQSLDVKIA